MMLDVVGNPLVCPIYTEETFVHRCTVFHIMLHIQVQCAEYLKHLFSQEINTGELESIITTYTVHKH